MTLGTENPQNGKACGPGLANPPGLPLTVPLLCPIPGGFEPASASIAFPSSLPPSGGTAASGCSCGCRGGAAGPHRLPIKLETTGINPQRTRAELFEKQQIWKASVIAKLVAVGSLDLADQLEACHTQKIYQICKGCRKVSMYWNHCDNFFCPVCQPALARARARTIEWWAKQIAQPKHVVLTTKNTEHVTSKQVKELKKNFTRLRRSTFAKAWRGGCYSIECTNEGRGWHLHIHALVDADWIDAKELAIKWGRITSGSGHIVKVKDVRQQSYLLEVTKYAVKGSQLATWSGAEIDEFVRAFHGNRQFEVFGTLRRARGNWKLWQESENLALRTCECGSDQFSYMSEDEYEYELLRQQLNAEARPPPARFVSPAELQLPLPHVTFSV